MRACITAFLATLAAFAGIGIAAATGSGVSELTPELVKASLSLGAILTVAGLVLSLPFGAARNFWCFTLSVTVAAAAVVAGLNYVEFQEVSIAATGAAAIYGLLSGLFGALSVRVLHGRRTTDRD